MWQYNDPPNPADAADGPQIYDSHLYYSSVFPDLLHSTSSSVSRTVVGVADANEKADMTSSCSKTSFSISSCLDVYMHFSVDLDRPKKDAEQGNDPVAFGEWSLATQFNANTTDAFRRSKPHL